jgi:hypothetical protein
MKKDLKGWLVLQAKKVKTNEGIKTELYQDNELKATIPAYQKQPNRNTKSIELNGWGFKIEWIK